MVMVTPLRKGSVFDAGMESSIYAGDKAFGINLRQLFERWIAGLKCADFVVNSPHRKRPEKARQLAAWTTR